MMSSGQFLLFLLCAVIGALAMYLVLRIFANRLQRVNATMRLLIERVRAEESLRRHCKSLLTGQADLQQPQAPGRRQ